MGIENDALILARTIKGEAGGESRAGKIAVGSVVMNRMRLKKWNAGKTVADTCLFCVPGQPYHQFSCWNENDPVRKRIYRAGVEALGECYEIAEGLLRGTIRNNVGNCTHYYAPAVCKTPKWAKGKTPKYTIGGHIFFDDID